MGGIKSENIILVIASIVVGSLIGEMIGIEKKLDGLGDKIQKTFGGKDSNFSKGFVTASLVYCIGAMAIVGGILILAIGINILGIKKIKVGNMLPAIFIPIIYYFLVSLLA